MVVKAVVFDVGGVLLEESGRESREILSKKFGFKGEDFESFVKENLKKSYYGKISGEEFFSMAKSKLNIGASVQELVEAWLEARRKTSKVNASISNMIKKLKERGYILACLSDTTKLNDIVRNELGAYDLFDEVILSVNENSWKPEEKIYNVLIEKLRKRNINPEESLFVDDRDENLVPAEKLGIKTLLFKDADKLKKDLIKLKVRL